MAKINTFSDEWMNRIEKCVKHFEGNFDPKPLRRHRNIVASPGGCESQNTIWDITIFGVPTGGTITLRVTVNAVATNLTFNWDDDTTDFKTTLATHAEIASTDLDVTAGPFPNTTMRVEFIGDLAGQLIDLPTAGWGSLTGGTGRGVIVAMSQRGHA